MEKKTNTYQKALIKGHANAKGGVGEWEGFHHLRTELVAPRANSLDEVLRKVEARVHLLDQIKVAVSLNQRKCCHFPGKEQRERNQVA